MTFRTSRWLVGAIRMALAMMFLACTLLGRPMYAQTADDATPGAAKAGTTTPAGAAKVTDKETCRRYIAALSGAQPDRALLHNADVQSLARLAPDLTTCGAVARDSDDPCNLLGDLEKNACRDSRLVYHELRKPDKRASILGDVQFENCRANKDMAQFCEALRTATRTGDPKKCPSGNLGTYCRAAIALDPSLCRFTGPNPEGQQRDCEKTIEKLKVWAPGLKGLAKSGPSPERELAKAALGEADACAPYEKKALDACIANLAKPVESPTAGAASPPPNLPTGEPPTPRSN